MNVNLSGYSLFLVHAQDRRMYTFVSDAVQQQAGAAAVQAPNIVSAL